MRDDRNWFGKNGLFSKTYDVSGRLKTDSSREITNITYNNDGIPLNVSFRDMSQQEGEPGWAGGPALPKEGNTDAPQ